GRSGTARRPPWPMRIGWPSPGTETIVYVAINLSVCGFFPEQSASREPGDLARRPDRSNAKKRGLLPRAASSRGRARPGSRRAGPCPFEEWRASEHTGPRGARLRSAAVEGATSMTNFARQLQGAWRETCAVVLVGAIAAFGLSAVIGACGGPDICLQCPGS